MVSPVVSPNALLKSAGLARVMWQHYINISKFESYQFREPVGVVLWVCLCGRCGEAYTAPS